MSGILVAMQGAVAQGVLWGIMVLGVYTFLIHTEEHWNSYYFLTVALHFEFDVQRRPYRCKDTHLLRHDLPLHLAL